MGSFYHIPYGCSFTDNIYSLLEDISLKGYSLKDITVVTPSRNAAFYLKKNYIHYLQKKFDSIFFPKFISLQSLIEEKFLSIGYSSSNIISFWEKLGWFTNYLKSFFPDFEVSQILKLAHSLIEIIDDIYKHKVDKKEINKISATLNISDKWHNSINILKNALINWDNFIKESNRLESYDYYENSLNILTKILHSAYREKPFIYVGSQPNIYSYRSSALDNFIKEILNLPEGYVVFEGGEKKNNIFSTNRYFQKIYSQINLRSIPYNSGDDDCITCERLNFIDNFLYKKSLPNSTSWFPIMLEEFSIYDEARLISLIVRYYLKFEHHDICIVTKNENLARIIEGELKSYNIIVNNSMGTVFSKTAVGVFLTLLSKLWQKFSWVNIIEVLKHPLCLINEREKALMLVRFFDVEILRSSRIKLDNFYKIADEIPENIGKIWSLFTTIISPVFEYKFSGKLVDILHLHKNMAVNLMGDGLEKSSDFRMALDFFEDVTNTLNIDKKVKILDYPETFQSLISCLDIVYFSDVIDSKIRILRPDEAIWHKEDIVVLAGLNEGSWPRFNTHTQWFNDVMKTRLNMPNALDTIDRETHEFCCLLNTQKVYLTRSCTDNQQPTTPSRFWRCMQSLNVISRAVPWSHWISMIEGTKNIHIKPPSANPDVEFRPKKISATDVQLLHQDPYAFYVKKCLKIKPFELAYGSITARKKGQFIHEVLHCYVTRFCNAPFFEEDFHKVCNEYLKNIHHIDSYACFLLGKKLKKISPYIIENLNQNLPLSILGEIKGEYKFLCSDSDITVVAIADRIDILANSINIIDYKNSTPPSLKSVEKLFTPQLVIEALLWSKGCFGQTIQNKDIYVSYWQLKNNNPFVKTSFLKINEDFLQKSEEYLFELCEKMLCQKTVYESNLYPQANSYSFYDHIERSDEWIFHLVD